jgi:tetratricopeptide (TPR) repeat protein
VRRRLILINSVYGVASLISRGVEPLYIIETIKGKGEKWESISRFMLDVASQCMRLHYYDAAESVLKVILDLSRKNGDRVTEGDCLTKMGRLMWSEDRGSDAVNCYSKAAAIYMELGDILSLGSVHFHTGTILWLMDDWEEALKHLEQAYQAIQNVEKDGVLEILVRMGSILFGMQRYEEAYIKYQEALNLSEELEDIKTKGICLWEVGAILEIKGRWEEALESFFEATKVKQDMRDRVGEQLCRIRVGKVLLKLGKVGEALEQFKEALTISKSDGNQLGEAVALFHIGVSNIMLKNNQRVREAFEKAIQTFEKGYSRVHLLVALNIYHDYLLSRGEKNRAEEISNKISEFKIEDVSKDASEQKRMVNERIEEIRKILKGEK